MKRWFGLQAERKDDFGRTIIDLVGFYPTPQDAMRESLVKKKQIQGFVGFVIIPKDIDESERPYMICFDSLYDTNDVSVYAYPMDAVTFSRYTGRKVGEVEVLKTGNTHWEALAKAIKDVENERRKYE